MVPEMYNFRITDVNGYRAVVWGGMTTEEQIHRMEKYSGNEIAFMHVSPKQDHQMFARLVQAINPKAVIPHHYDIWETLFAAKPELLADMKLPADKVNAEGVLDVIRQNIKENCRMWHSLSRSIINGISLAMGSWKHKENLADRIWKIVVYL